ncbi:MAG: glycoside hydrolase family 1 protein [Deltaproteobacteria bacterium]|nr:glycoside hydrolase family 1 protein [Deltaproteobacteria bacterium]
MTDRGRFPEGFLFGCATSAFQIEGGIHNDWSEWAFNHHSPEERRAFLRATDHWSNYAADFARLGALKANAYRLSLEWARIEPTPGVYDAAALDQYARMVEALRTRAIEPIVTLLHFTHPSWFHERCPWHQTRTDAPKRFADFVRRVAERLEGVRYWTVLNEPSVWLAGAHVGAVIPPAVPGIGALRRAFSALVEAHDGAYAILKAETKGRAQVGIAQNVVQFEPSRPRSRLDRLATQYIARQYNHTFIQNLLGLERGLPYWPRRDARVHASTRAPKLDFIGLNYYSRLHVELNLASVWANAAAAGRISKLLPLSLFYEDRAGLGVSDLGWEIYPRGLYSLLVEMNQYGRPLIVTENGLDDRDDSRRCAFLYDHLGAVLDAIAAGVDVRGYLHWSLLDNFEWLEAFEPRFGLYRVDYTDMSRHATQAVDLFRDIANHRRLPALRPPAAIKSMQGRIPVAGITSPKRGVDRAVEESTVFETPQASR